MSKELLLIPRKILRKFTFHWKVAWRKIARPPAVFRDSFHLPDLSHVQVFSAGTLGKNENIASTCKTTLIAVAKNEAPNVDAWFDRIMHQLRLPDEIIIVDGGSTDGTFVKLKAFTQNNQIPVHILENPGGNIAQSRNLAVQNAAHDIIAVTDFGCFPKLDWLENLLQPFENDREMVVSAGVYDPVSQKRNFARKQRRLFSWSTIDGIDPQQYLPPGGCVAFKKSVWGAVGGYPEWLTLTGEDTYFDLALKHYGGKWAFVPDAVVEWQAPDTAWAYLRKMYAWATGDGESGVHARIFWGYAVRLFLLLVLVVMVALSAVVIAILPIQPVVLWLGVVGVICLAGAWSAMRKTRLSSSLLLQRVLGELAQLLGFLKGAGNRKLVEARRFSMLNGYVFVLAGVPLEDTGGGSRSAQIALELVQQGYSVVYLYRFPRYETRDLHLYLAHPNLFEFPLADFHLEKWRADHPALATLDLPSAIIEFPAQEFIPLLKKIKAIQGRILYDLIDDWQTSLGGRWYSREVDEQIIQMCDALSATVTPLQERLQKSDGRVVALLPNAVNERLFNPAIDFPRPPDLPEGRRIYLYHGALWGDWFDWDLLKEVAARFKESCICVIGDYRGQFPDVPPNLIFPGLKAQSELPAYLAHADAAIIPWKRTAITEATSPLKIYEYLAMHIPVVAPSLPQLKNIPGVLLAQNKEDFVNLISQAKHSTLPEEEIKDFIEGNTWQYRVSQMLDLLDHADRREDLNP